ncbi:hypothetical protein [Streptomyces sp. NPDC087856]
MSIESTHTAIVGDLLASGIARAVHPLTNRLPAWNHLVFSVWR